MFFQKLKKSLFTLDTLEYWGIAATLIAANYWSFQDEDDHVHMTRILATGHTIFTYVKNLSNLRKACIEPEDRKIVWLSTGFFNASAAGTLASVWLTDDALLNFVSGIGNATCNFFSKFITHSNKRIKKDIDLTQEDSIGFDPEQKDLPPKSSSSKGVSSVLPINQTSSDYQLHVDDGSTSLHPSLRY